VLQGVLQGQEFLTPITTSGLHRRERSLTNALAAIGASMGAGELPTLEDAPPILTLTRRSAMLPAGSGGGGGKQPGGSRNENDEEKRLRWRRRLQRWRRRRNAHVQAAASVFSIGLITIKRLRFGELNLFLSYKGDTKSDLETFESLHLKVHPLVYSKRTCTLDKLLFQIRNDLIMDLLGQVHRNFNNIGTLISQRLGFGLTAGAAPTPEESEGDVDESATDADDTPATSPKAHRTIPRTKSFGFNAGSLLEPVRSMQMGSKEAEGTPVDGLPPAPSPKEGDKRAMLLGSKAFKGKSRLASFIGKKKR